MFATGVSMYGQMTAGSYCYIGPQVGEEEKEEEKKKKRKEKKIPCSMCRGENLEKEET